MAPSKLTSMPIRFPVIVLFTVAWLFCAPAAYGQTRNAAVEETEQQLHRLSLPIESSIQSEKSQVSGLADDLKSFDALEKSIKMGIDGFNLQQANFQSLMVFPEVSARQLEDTFKNLQLVHADIRKQHGSLQQQKEQLEKALESSTEQLSLVNGQQQSISALAGKKQQAASLLQKTAQLKQLILSKQKSYQKLRDRYERLILQLEAANQGFSELSSHYQQFQTQRNSRELLYRSVSLFSSQWPSFVVGQLEESAIRTAAAFNRQNWRSRFGSDQPANLYAIVSLLLLLTMVGYAGRRLSRFLTTPYWTALAARYPSTALPLLLLRKSSSALALALFLAVYLEVAGYSSLSYVIQLVIDLLSIWIMTSWGLLFVAAQAAALPISGGLVGRLQGLIRFLRWFGIAFWTLNWLFQYDATLLMAGRYLLELTLCGFGLSAWRNRRGKPPSQPEAMKRTPAPELVSGVMLVVAFTGLVLEIAGYGALALFWYISWGHSCVIAIWGWMLAGVLKAPGRREERQERPEGESLAVARHQAKWLVLRLLQLALPLGLLFLLVIAWGGRRFFQDNVFAILRYGFRIGDIEFSLLSTIKAILVLLGTHIVTMAGRFLLRKRLLARSKMEVGLKDSVTAITVYLIWTLGIILALNAFGMNPTTLMVVFGALGIGLGFGLQNIFNNFMSGLILLFERPIQVGDDIEINGTWATVRKINVRSTLVQTYDNASLIIPNSDLINNQVINWSFKDKRLRRKITVGVAYGSDVELVRQTLLAVATETKNVLKYPAPDVLFSDFGDSALIFTLRIWTYVDAFLAVETTIRFGIDDAFRKKGITIAFPQQDVHLYPAEIPEHGKP